MGSGGQVAVHAAFYAAFPIAFVAFRPPLRHVLLYVYLGSVLTVGGFLGSLYSIPITDDVAVSAGSLAYGAFMLTTFIAVIVAQDARVLRHALAILLALNLFKYGLYTLTAQGIADDSFLHRVPADPAVFQQSLRVVTLGGVLIAAELLLLLALVEVTKRRLGVSLFAPAAYIALFGAILVLDGVMFPVAVFPFDDALPSLISSGVRAKLVLAGAYGTALAIFLVLYRSTVRRFHATPLPVARLVFAHRRDVLARLERSESELAESREALEESVVQTERQRQFTHALSTIDRSDGSVSATIRGLANALRGLSDRYSGQLGVLVVHDDLLIGTFGASSAAREFSSHVLDQARDSSSWLEDQRPSPAAMIALRRHGALLGVLEVGLNAPASNSDLRELEAVRPVLENFLHPAIEVAQNRWSERAPIRSLLEDGPVGVVFQPIVDLRDRSVFAFEALCRFEPDTDPSIRFREAARLGLGIELDLLAIRTAMAQLGGLPPDVPVTVNLSQATLLSPALAPVLRQSDRPIILELSEHEPAIDYEAVADAARALGAQLAVDDAGSGYASLQRIVRLRPDLVKLDRSWVTGIDADRPRQMLLGGLVAYAAEVHATLVAEGVETDAELETLVTLGVGHGQGHLFGRPGDAASFSCDAPNIDITR